MGGRQITRTFSFPLMPRDIERFWRFVNVTEDPDACWLWKGVDTSTHPLFTLGGSRHQASRVAYAIHYGRAPVGYMCHTCDTHSCVNPHHLWDGTFSARFWARVAIGESDECWPWTVGFRKGYGTVKRDDVKVGAHRVAWELTNGPIPDGLCVLHRCDNPPCCNPAHLFLGTLLDNSRDMLAKGRARPTNYGKITKEIADEIRRRYAAGGITMSVLGAEYGTTRSNVGTIVRGKSWK